ncbi:2OG-Fe(II) oxygenase [Pyxidicoccus sp. 3LG]
MSRAPALANVIDKAIAEPGALASALRKHLGPHPVPQSDARTRGLMVELSAHPEDRARLQAELPALSALLPLVSLEPGILCVLAVNETPPTSPDSFLLRPHVDRRYLPEGFSERAPRTTTVVFLDFPPEGQGGELVIFPRGAFDGREAPPREDARRTVAQAGGLLVEPRPGRACRFEGDLPHAVLGYAAPEGQPWRLAIVLAELDVVPGEPPPQWLLPEGP